MKNQLIALLTFLLSITFSFSQSGGGLTGVIMDNTLNNNLSDETYYKGWSTINPLAPSSFLGTLTYTF